MRASGPKRQAWLATAAGKYGVVGRKQLIGHGISPAAIGRLVASGELEPIHRGIYLVAGRERSWGARVMAATMLSHGHASHRSAATLWRLLDAPTVEVTTQNRPRDGGVIWHRTVLRRGDRTVVQNIPVTSIHRTLIDLGDVVADDVVEDALDRALERRLTSPEWLRAQLDDLGTTGRKGAAALRSILDAGQEKASWLEVLLGVEVHGAKWHRRRKRWAKDLARHNDLTVYGWTVLHFTWADVKDRSDEVISEITATYERLALRLGLDTR